MTSEEELDDAKQACCRGDWDGAGDTLGDCVRAMIDHIEELEKMARAVIDSSREYTSDSAGLTVVDKLAMARLDSVTSD